MTKPVWDGRISHLTYLVEPGGRKSTLHRLRSIGIRKNLCGAELTDLDLLHRDFKVSLRDPEWAPRMCPDCANLMRARELRKQVR